MAKRTSILKITLAATAIILIAAFCRVTIVPDAVPLTVTDDQGNVTAATQLTVAETYCQENWETKILPTISDRAIDPAAFAEGFKSDLGAIGTAHAARANETSPWSFCLKGKAKVLGIEDADKKTKTRLLLDVPPYDDQPDLKVQTSTVIKTNAIRDAVGFLKLDDFANQVEFAELTKAFNARIQHDLLKGLDTQALVGQEIELTGCVSVTGAKDEEVLVVPISIEPVGA